MARRLRSLACHSGYSTASRRPGTSPALDHTADGLEARWSEPPLGESATQQARDNSDSGCPGGDGSRAEGHRAQKHLSRVGYKYQRSRVAAARLIQVFRVFQPAA